MHPAFSELALHDHRRDLERNLRKAYLRRQRPAVVAPLPEPVTLRLCCVRDDDALDRLAALEGLAAPKGRHVVAEVDGVVVAALPLAAGRALADPFRPTAHLLPLLELRAKQLADDHPRRLPRWRAVWSWSRA